ncbi:DUF262 domain-containing protein [Spirosoma flavus]
MKIADVILNRVNRDYLLPSIQREFVWLKSAQEKKIEKLFDSVMQEYPIGTILTWGIDKDPNAESIKWELYNFVQDYDKDNPHNELANTNGYNKLFLLLDGQQRISALNIGLRGKYSFTLYNKKRELKLYLNLFGDLENDLDNTYGAKYQFEFKSSEAGKLGELWFEVGKVLDFRDDSTEDFKEAYDELIRENTTDKALIKQAKSTLGQLHKVICSDNVLQEQVVQTNDDEKVLNIFVRTNDGGVKLEKADLLLSYMESNRTLFQPKGARQELFDFVDQLNKEELHKPNYKFGKDDVLKACLVMSDLEVQYKIKNFNSENLAIISGNWHILKKYLSLTVKLIAQYGFMPQNIVSQYAFIPIAYYLQKNKYSDTFIASQTNEHIAIKTEIIKWFTKAQLTGAFGSSSDSTLKTIRTAINEGKSFEEINLGKKIDRDDVEKWLSREHYRSRLSHLLLMMITETRYWEECHQDHIFPLSKFKDSVYDKYNLTAQDRKFYNQHANSIANLHLLNSSVNISKSNNDFIDWSANQNKVFLAASHIPPDIFLGFNNFTEFIHLRTETLTSLLLEKLQ